MRTYLKTKKCKVCKKAGKVWKHGRMYICDACESAYCQQTKPNTPARLLPEGNLTEVVAMKNGANLDKIADNIQNKLGFKVTFTAEQYLRNLAKARNEEQNRIIDIIEKDKFIGTYYKDRLIKEIKQGEHK